MATLDDYVTISITRDQVGISQIGFGTQMILGYSATWPERIRYYSDLPGMVSDGFATDSPEYLAANAAFAQTPRPVQIAIGRGLNKPTKAYAIGINTFGAAGTTYAISVSGRGVTSSTASFTTLADIVLGTVTPAADTIVATAHGMASGDGPYYISNAGGGLPAPLTADTPYWVIKVDADTIKLATSKALALVPTPIDITTAGTGTQTLLRGATNQDVVIQQLVAQLNAVTGANYTAATTGSTGSLTMTVTATSAGAWFDLAINDPALLSNKQTQTDPGIAADLNAIALASTTDWYALSTLFNSQAIVVAAAGWTESAGRKIYVPQICETAAVTTAGGTGGSADTIDALCTLKYTRTMAIYHPNSSQMAGPAWLGKMLPKDPGSATWKFKSLAGVSAVTFTTTQKTNLRSRQGNSIQLVAGLSITFEGTVADGEFMDAIVGDDWVANDMQVRVFNVEAGGDKVEYEDSGIARIEAAVIATLKEAVRRKIYAAKPAPTVTVPLEADINPTDKATRTLNNVKWSAKRSGAIHKSNVQGTVVL